MTNLHNTIAYDNKNNLNSWKSQDTQKREPKDALVQAMNPKQSPACIKKNREF